jgi:hypothetical protein
VADRAEIATLASRIRQSAETGEVVETELSTNERIIARVTDGIYREPWAAYRELIANAYDADATRVVIETGAPDFSQVVVRDNGNGMRPDTVAYVVKSIGGSSKRTSSGAELETVDPENPDFSPGGRPLIGKIGIGLFAVAQLTQHFQIVTKARGELTRTSATVLLRTHNEKALRDLPKGRRYAAGRVKIKAEPVPKEEIDSHGTTVILYSLRPEVRRALQSVLRWQAAEQKGPDGKPVRDPPIYHIGLPPGLLKSHPDGIPPALPWKQDEGEAQRFLQLIEAAEVGSEKATKPADLEHFDEYLRMIWQLSLGLPLPYVEEHPFDKTGSSDIDFLSISEAKAQALPVTIESAETLRKHFSLEAGLKDPLGGFEIIIDGIHLRRPIRLPNILRRKSRLKHPVMLIGKVGRAFSKTALERAGGNLRFEAYLYWNSKIVPKDTTGVLIRIHGASGTLFDQSFLRYQVSEQTRLRQITAEIFVQEGLDPAINIDRESFNYSHPHFLFIQRWLHRALRLLVNRLKKMADQDLELEREESVKRAATQLVESALSVWVRRQGAESDPPISAPGVAVMPPEVAGVELDWQNLIPHGSRAKAIAMAVVLESYGILSSLPPSERVPLIRDLLNTVGE